MPVQRAGRGALGRAARVGAAICSAQFQPYRRISLWVIVAIVALFLLPLTIEYVVRPPRRQPTAPRRGRHGSCIRSPISFRS